MEADNAENKTIIKEVPETIDDITPQWCEEILKSGGFISTSDKILTADASRLVNEETGALDGGGMTAAQMIRIKLTYDGEPDEKYENPKSMIAKCLFTGKLQFAPSLPWRLMMYFMYRKNMEEDWWRCDIKFYREAIPLVKNSYKHPDVYYTGIIDGGNRGFFDEVLRTKDHKIRTVTVMKDMQGWKSQMVGQSNLTFNEAAAILQNAAILHGHFWGEKNKNVKSKFNPSLSETDIRASSYSKLMMKKRNRFSANASSIQKTSKKMVKNWESHPWFKISKNSLLPYWLKPAEDSEGDIILTLKDPNILEMMNVFAERFPEFSNEFNKPFLQMPSQTMLHGDFHNGNHMYKEDEDGTVRVVAFDFQGVGHGAAMSDVIKLLALSKTHVSLTEEFELMKKYHEALVQSGVTDYSYDELKKHFMIAGTELLAKYTMEFCDNTPEKYTKFFKDIFGEEKWADLNKMFESGIIGNIFILMTSMYIHNKDSFLKGSSFFNII